MATQRTEVDMIVKAIAEGFDKMGSEINKIGNAQDKLALSVLKSEAAQKKLAAAELAVSKNADSSKQNKLAQAMLKARIAADQADKETKEYAATLAKLQKQSDAAAKGTSGLRKTLAGFTLSDLNAGMNIAGRGLRVLKDGFDSLKEGAAARQTGLSFEFLRAKVDGATNVLEQLRTATRGTVSDQVLMTSTLTLAAGAGDELGKQLFDAAPRLAEIAKAADKLNPALGGTAHIMESLGTGIKRNAPLLIDNSGLTIKIGAANEAMALSLGKSVQALSAEEKQLALLNATLAAGDKLIAQVGGTTDATGDSITRLETGFENFITSLKVDAADAFVTTIDSLSVVFGETQTRTEEYAQALKVVTQEFGANSQQAALVRAEMESWNNVVALASAETQVFQSDMREMAIAMGEAPPQIEATTQSIDNLNVSTRETITATDLLTAGSQKLTQAFIFQQAAQGLSAEAAIELGVAMGVLEADSIAVAGAIDSLKTKYDANADGAISGAEAAAGFSSQVQALGASVDALQSKEITVTVTTIRQELFRQAQEAARAETGTGRQHGGRLAAGQFATLHPPEIAFTPKETTFIMSQSDTKKLLQGNGLGGSSPVFNVTINANSRAEGRAAADGFEERLGARFRANRGAGRL